jgi:hypothetical protein
MAWRSACVEVLNTSSHDHGNVMYSFELGFETTWIFYHPSNSMWAFFLRTTETKMRPYMLVTDIAVRVNPSALAAHLSITHWEPLFCRHHLARTCHSPSFRLDEEVEVAAALLRDAVSWCVSGISASASMGTAFNGLNSCAQKNLQRVIIWTNLIYYAWHITLNKQEGGATSAIILIVQGIYLCILCRRENMVISLVGQLPSWDF